MADRVESCENLKTIVLTKIRYLDEQLSRYQHKCDKQEEVNMDLNSQVCERERACKGISDRFKVSQEAKDKEKDDLKEWLANEKLALAWEEEALKLEHIQLMKELREQIDELRCKSMNQDIKYEEEKKLMVELERYKVEVVSLKDMLAHQKEEHDAAIQSITQELQHTRELLVETLIESERENRQEEERDIQSLEELIVDVQKEIELLSDENLTSERNDLREHMSELTEEFLASRKEIVEQKKNIKEVIQKLCKMDICIKDMEKEELRVRADQIRQSEHPPPKPILPSILDDEIEMHRIRSEMAEDIIQDAAIIIRHIQTDSSNTKWKMRRLLTILESASTT